MSIFQLIILIIILIIHQQMSSFQILPPSRCFLLVFLKETLSLFRVFLCPACAHSTSDSAQQPPPQESDTEMLTDEQQREIRKENREDRRKRDLSAAGFACGLLLLPQQHHMVTWLHIHWAQMRIWSWSDLIVFNHGEYLGISFKWS